MTDPKWTKIAAQKQAQQHARLIWYLSEQDLDNKDPHAAIGIIESKLTPKELEITALKAHEIASKIARSELTALQVTQAFCKRASYCTQLLSCCTEILFVEALERAKQLDEHLARTGKVVGPLHGIPISIKDAFDIKGYDTSIGWTALAFQPAKSSAPVVELIEKLGGVLYCKTNVPAAIMTADTENLIFGKTKNPYNILLGAGGSSGGEGALIAAHGSPLGVGTDLAGSVRIPSLCNGTYGLRPTSNRFPTQGFAEPLEPGADLLVKSVAGPMANSVEDLKLLFQSIIDAEPWKTDGMLSPLPFRRVSIAPAKLRIGILHSIGLTQPHPPVTRALNICRDKLRAAGHDVFIVQDFPSVEDIVEISTGSESVDGFEFSKKMAAINDEPMIKSFVAAGFDKTPRKTAQDLLRLNVKWKKLQRNMNLWWYKTFPTAYDVLICPGAAHTAIEHDTYIERDYTVLWNTVDYPAAIIPVTRVDKSIDIKDDSTFESLSQRDAINRAKYNAELLHGMPVCVQVVGTKLHEEELVETMKVIDAVVHDT